MSGAAKPAYDLEQQFKLYLIEKAETGLGQGAVSRVVTDPMFGNVSMYFYVDGIRDSDQAVRHAISVLNPDIFEQGNAGVSVMFSKDVGRAGGDEKLYSLEVSGALTDIVANIQKNDAAVFAAAQTSHAAQQLLQREERRAQAMGGKQ